MKNIIKVALLSLLCLGAVSCDLNKYPSSAIPEQEGFKTFMDAGEFRNGFYNFSRLCFSAYTVIPVNIQGEGINATKDYGNNYGFQYTWNFSDNDDVVTTLWTNCYAAIFQINYFLEKAAELLKADSELGEFDENRMDASELELLQLYIAEAHFFRAMINHQLATFYCKAYDPATASQELGIILSDVADVYARKERSTLEKTYEAINEDITYAKDIIDTYYASHDTDINYVDPYTVKCLQAKVMLDRHQYLESAALCEEIVAAHPLINNQSTFNSMWRNDSGSEIVFQFYASKNEGRTQLGGMFLNDPYNTGSPLYPYYIPSQWFVDQYDSRDIRKAAYFKMSNVRIGTSSYNLYVLSKYPGNPAYNTTAAQNDLMNNVRPYRSADFVLIAAECYARANDLGNANNSLKRLLEARMTAGGGDPYTYENYGSIDEIMEAIKQERLKEMFMEGNRIADLKRWGDPMSRLGQDPQSNGAVANTSIYLDIPASDYRFVWPVPQAEMNSNSSVSNQQNEGWTR